MASRNFTHLALLLANGDVDFGADTFRAIIVDAVPTESNLDTWDFRNDVTDEITDPDYTAGGFLVNATVGSLDTANDRVPITFVSDDTPTYTAATISGVGCIIYKVVGSAATDPLIAFVDWGGTESSTSGDFDVTFDTPLYINVNP
jgi:hypothetical protein